MKKVKQNIIIQEPQGGLTVKSGRRTVHNIEDHGEFWTGQATLDKNAYTVKLVSQPVNVDTWYGNAY